MAQTVLPMTSCTKTNSACPALSNSSLNLVVLSPAVMSLEMQILEGLGDITYHNLMAGP